MQGLFTSVLVYLVEQVAGRAQHAHVGPELLDEGGDHVLGGGGARHADALGRHLLAGVLEVEPHHAVELQVLQQKVNITTC